MPNKPTFATIASEDELAEWIEERSSKMLCVFDLHLSWTGHCQSLTPTFLEFGKKYEIDNCSERLAILTLDVSKLEFENVLGSSNDLSKKGCRPLFALVRDGKLLAKVEDANTPKLEELLNKHVPPLPAAVENEFNGDVED
jgi:thiol-disulfide isomerase/thioredoxin